MTRDRVIAALRAAGCVFAEDEAELLLAEPALLDERLARRIAGEPLEQVLGWAAFDGLRISVTPGVFVPRRRSELMVALAADGLRPGDVVVDLCCGSGALGAALRHRVPGIELHAADADPIAVECARRNLEVAWGSAGAPPGPGGTTPALPLPNVWRGDLWNALPTRLRGRVSTTLANAPYVPSDAIALMPTEARDHEPRTALDGGADGLDLHRRIAAEASRWLAPGGRLLIEVSDAQVDAAVRLFERHGLATQVHADDELDATVVIGTNPLG